MRDALVGLLLGCGVLAAWLGSAGFLRLRAPLDRLHCVTFAAAAAGGAFAAAAFAQDGASGRSLKLLLLVLVSLLTGAGLAHATGRALVRRTAAGEPD